jgi:hypothetical protein
MNSGGISNGGSEGCTSQSSCLPLMEDIALSRLLNWQGRVACLRSQVITSARRWERDGVWRTILKMWAFRLLFLAGVSPMRLKRFYGDAR